MAEPQQLTDQEQGQLALLYQNVTANLEARKKQQWQVLIFYSAVAALLISQVDKMGTLTRITAAVVIVIGAYPTRRMILLYQDNMTKERKALDALYNHFSDKFDEFRRVKGSVTETDCFEKFFLRGSGFYLVAVMVLSTTAFVGKEIGVLLAYLCRAAGLR